MIGKELCHPYAKNYANPLAGKEGAFTRFTRYEIRYVAEFTDGIGRSSVESVNSATEEAQAKKEGAKGFFFGLYGVSSAGAQWIADFDTFADAEELLTLMGVY